LANIYMALVHYPVYNKNREVIASALTTIDLHDLSRLAATYNLAGLYVVTPLEDQLRVAQEMIDHWCHGWGKAYNRNRSEALSLVRLARSIRHTRAEITETCGLAPILIGTSASTVLNRATYEQVSALTDGKTPVLLLLGTAWGLTTESLAECDYNLEPIYGPTAYNHLSVRSAAGIILDRLFGRR